MERCLRCSFLIQEYLIDRHGNYYCPNCDLYKHFAVEDDSEVPPEKYDEIHRHLKNIEFDAALKIIDTLLEKYHDEAELYFLRALTTHQIVYVLKEMNDVYERYPTFVNLNVGKICEANDAKKALELAKNEEDKKRYQKDFENIDSTRIEIQKVLNDPKYDFDVFISFKKTKIDNVNEDTLDYEIARELYLKLREEKPNLKIFFAPVTLKKMAGVEYEKIIFNALYKSKVMILVGTSRENINSIWVRNEWKRYLKSIKTRAKSDDSLLIVLNSENLVSDLPSGLNGRQCSFYNSSLVYDLMPRINDLIGNVYYLRTTEVINNKIIAYCYGDNIKDLKQEVFLVDGKIQIKLDSSYKSIKLVVLKDNEKDLKADKSNILMESATIKLNNEVQNVDIVWNKKKEEKQEIKTMQFEGFKGVVFDTNSKVERKQNLTIERILKSATLDKDRALKQLSNMDKNDPAVSEAIIFVKYGEINSSNFSSIIQNKDFAYVQEFVATVENFTLSSKDIKLILNLFDADKTITYYYADSYKTKLFLADKYLYYSANFDEKKRNEVYEYIYYLLIKVFTDNSLNNMYYQEAKDLMDKFLGIEDNFNKYSNLLITNYLYYISVFNRVILRKEVDKYIKYLPPDSLIGGQNKTEFAMTKLRLDKVWYRMTNKKMYSRQYAYYLLTSVNEIKKDNIADIEYGLNALKKELHEDDFYRMAINYFKITVIIYKSLQKRLKKDEIKKYKKEIDNLVDDALFNYYESNQDTRSSKIYEACTRAKDTFYSLVEYGLVEKDKKIDPLEFDHLLSDISDIKENGNFGQIYSAIKESIDRHSTCLDNLKEARDNYRSGKDSYFSRFYSLRRVFKRNHCDDYKGYSVFYNRANFLHITKGIFSFFFKDLTLFFTSVIALLIAGSHIFLQTLFMNGTINDPSNSDLVLVVNFIYLGALIALLVSTVTYIRINYEVDDGVRPTNVMYLFTLIYGLVGVMNFFINFALVDSTRTVNAFFQVLSLCGGILAIVLFLSCFMPWEVNNVKNCTTNVGEAFLYMTYFILPAIFVLLHLPMYVQLFSKGTIIWFDTNDWYYYASTVVLFPLQTLIILLTDYFVDDRGALTEGYTCMIIHFIITAVLLLMYIPCACLVPYLPSNNDAIFSLCLQNLIVYMIAGGCAYMVPLEEWCV